VPAAAAGVLAAGYGLRGEGVAPGSLARHVAEEEPTRPPRRARLLGGSGGVLAARLAPLVGLGALAVAVGLGGREVPAWRRASWLVGAYLLATPNLFPWYALWIVPLLAAAPAWPWLYLSCAVGLTYLVFAQPVGDPP
jgi:hypothetical protein